ncbi:phage tail protein I [Xylanibacillus composti]|uniref:Phage tail protein I n=1 Tax=Xylanibacillus composti TaxID=1572762 RepID=A0A8J4H698_9BACL|nr:phage tail protein I [Xylanibacillus composti]MDT9724263.1 phage tail protein I [Xylanibacillus composti]GIQ69258.1 hypothetical protein XYCOK13_20820 [Xylanibacillus composti]
MINFEHVKLIDLIPSNMRNDSRVIAAAISIDRQLKLVTLAIQKVELLHHIDSLPSKWIDQLAWQFHVDFYDQTLPIGQRRALVKNSLAWHKRKGTPSAVRELVETVFQTGEVLEWFQYGGQPYFFKVVTSDPSATGSKAQEFLAAVNSVKNCRSWLEGVELSENGEMNVYLAGSLHKGDYTTYEQVG